MDERSLFLAALDQPTPAERVSWLREACGENAVLRERVAALLAAHDSSSSLLEQPPLADSLLPTQALATDTSRIPRSELSTLGDRTKYISGIVQPSPNPESLGRLGPYEILAVLGHGGMGVVLKGYDAKLNRHVAIKVLASQFAANPESRKRFLREAQAAAAVVHPHVVTIYAVDDGEPPYLAMELVAGDSLQDRIDRDGALPLPEILRIGSQIAAGLAAAHARGLVHRDIKPANILLEAGTQRVKLTDFGLARAVDDVGLTGDGLIVGTPLFMSPEQSQGHTVDHRSDLFSLGSVLYALATGKSPFHADTTLAVIHRVCDDTPLPVHEVNKALPPWLSQLIARLMEKKPEGRLATANEVATLCERLLASVENGEACELGWDRRKQFPSRAQIGRRTALAVGGLATCLLLMAIFWWFPSGKQLGFIAPGAISKEGSSQTTTVARIPPPLAKTPFSAAEAKSLQQKWADHLGIKVEFTSKVGMKFRLIPPGEYTFGMTKEQYDEVLATKPPEWASGLPREAEQRLVKIDRPFYLGVYEVTVADFRRFAEAEKYLTYAERPESGGGRTNPDTTMPPDRQPGHNWRSLAHSESEPVGQLVLDDLRAYLAWLDRETGCTNTLPNEEQWEYACRAGTTEHWCDRKTPEEAEKLGWFQPSAGNQVLHDVGLKLPNAFGLYDMLGNAGEWTWAIHGGNRVVERGGCAGFPVWLCRSTSHISRDVNEDWYTSGFRVAIVGDLTKIPQASAPSDDQAETPARRTRPAIAAAPFSAEEAQGFQDAWAAYLDVPVEFDNAVGMKFRLIPPGKYLMGSTQQQVEEALPMAAPWTRVCVAAEFPQMAVDIEEPFYLGKYELTRRNFERFVKEEEYKTEGERSGVGGWKHSNERKWHQSPEYTWRYEQDNETLQHPVRFIAAEDVQKFCQWMRKYDGGNYVIPTEQQWELACRAGTTGQRYSDEPVLAKLAACTGELRPVGTKPANPFGLHDMLGNVFEVAHSRDSSRRFATRGGCYLAQAAESECRSAYFANAHGDAYQGAFAEGYRIAIVGDLKKAVDATPKRPRLPRVTPKSAKAFQKVLEDNPKRRPATGDK